MLNNVLLKTLKDKRKTFAWWSLGVTLLVFWYNIMFTTIEGVDVSAINQMMESQFIQGLIGGAYDLTSPEGWLSAELLPLLGPLIFIVFAVSFATSTLTVEEEKGTLNLLLTNPISRLSVYTQKFFALTVGLFSLGLVFWVGNIIGTTSADMGLSFFSLAEVTFSLVLLGLLFGAFSLALGGLTGKDGLSKGIASAVGIISYLLNSMSEIVESLEPFQPVSVFHYYGGGEVLLNGIDFGDVGILLAGTVVLFAVGMYGFQRRDIGT
ncbi:ABC transporter permease subunit [Candidatus Bipolaricaulota bacterium]|nr:ABC transporter permease subunit [Candidatus Bipolaricaulota bacterium]